MTEHPAGPKYEMGSPAWIDLHRAFLAERLPDLPGEAHGARFSMCEVLTDPPAHLDDGTARIAFWFRITAPDFEFGLGEDRGTDAYVSVDYRQNLGHAQEVVDTSGPELGERAEAFQKEVEESGAGRLAAPPEPLLPLLVSMHNHVAAHTA